MACSMTGFAEASAENGDFAITIGIRSVNHRSLDIKLKLPAAAAALESRIAAGRSGIPSGGEACMWPSAWNPGAPPLSGSTGN